METQRVISLVSFEAEAEARILAATEEAGRIREEARRAGREEGRAEGRALQSREAAEAVARVLAEVERTRGRLEREAERDLVRLAVAVAARIVRTRVSLGVPVAEESLREAVRRCARKHGLEIRMHPSEIRSLEAAASDLLRDMAVPGGASWVADPAVEPGGCVVRCVEGSVDLGIDTQLAEIERGLIGASDEGPV